MRVAALILVAGSILLLAMLVRQLYRLDRIHGHPGNRRHADQWHHGYLALISLGIGVGILIGAGPGWIQVIGGALAGFGLWCAIDDLDQHRAHEKNPLVKSFLASLYARFVHRRV